MKKYTYLGVNGNDCCILTSLLPFDMLDEGSIEESDFASVRATDWGGSDSISRTVELENLTLTGKKIILKEPIIFRGCDYDMGHTYGWKFKVTEIHEVVD